MRLLLLAIFFALSVNLPCVLAQTSANSAHDAVDQAVSDFSDAISDPNVNVESIGSSTSGYLYIPGTGAVCDETANGYTINVKKGELVQCTLSSFSPNSLWSITGTDFSVASKLKTSHQEINAKIWDDYLEETPLDSSSLPNMYMRQDVIYFKALKTGSNDVFFKTSVPNDKDPTQKINRSIYICIEVTE